MLVDDGTNTYLSADGVQAAINGSGTTSYALDDALGSIRGLTDSSGALTGSADYDAFGAVRAQSGSSLPLGFTGQLTDPTTGYLDLRARDLDPTFGRFLARDPVSPNAPGSQGYNPYAYVANNTTTWTDPSGQSIGSAASETLLLLQAAFRIRQYTTAIIEGITLLDVGSPLQKVGGAVELIFAAVAGALDAPCRTLAGFFGKTIDTYGSRAPAGPWTLPIQSMRFAIQHFPTIPTSVLCTINTVGMAYEATHGIPTSVEIGGTGDGGVGAGGGGACNNGNSSDGPSDDHGEQNATANSRFATFWYKSTFNTDEDSLNYHWRTHGQPFGKTREEYTNDAEGLFAKNKQNAKPVTLKDGTPGLRIRTPSGPGGYFTLSGQIVSFWYK